LLPDSIKDRQLGWRRWALPKAKRTCILLRWSLEEFEVIRLCWMNVSCLCRIGLSKKSNDLLRRNFKR
jgi:hypothetical protein